MCRCWPSAQIGTATISRRYKTMFLIFNIILAQTTSLTLTIAELSGTNEQYYDNCLPIFQGHENLLPVFDIMEIIRAEDKHHPVYIYIN
jgi:hypothetical protein